MEVRGTREMELRDWIQVGLMFALVAVTVFYAWRTYKISQSSDKATKATAEQAKATVALASREYVKEFIRLTIHPLLAICNEVKKKLDLNYFGHDFKTGWPEIYGLPSELNEEEAKVLTIGTFGGREVFSYPEPSLGILKHRYYTAPAMNLFLRLQSLRDEHEQILKHVDDFDTKQLQLDNLLRSAATEVKRAVVPYVTNAKGENFQFNSELDEGRFVSYVAEICFNYLLLTPKDFDTFFKQFERNQAKDFWEQNKSNLQALLNTEEITEKVNRLKDFSNQLSTELSQIIKSLEDSEYKYRRECYITVEELPPFPFS